MADDERVPSAKRLSEQRKRDAELRYEPEMESRKVGWGDPALVYDEEKDLFRFRDGCIVSLTAPTRSSLKVFRSVSSHSTIARDSVLLSEDVSYTRSARTIRRFSKVG